MPIFQYSAKTGHLEVFHHVGTNFYSFFVDSRLISKSGSLLVIFSLLQRWLGFASGALTEETLSFVIPAGRVKVIFDNGYKLTLQEKQLAVGTGHEILVQLHRLVNRIGNTVTFPNRNRWPSWLKLAETFIGVSEIPGSKHNPVIVSWLILLKAWWRDDETPYCAVFVSAVLKKLDMPIPKAYYRAAAFMTYGNNLRTDRLSPGAILVFKRKGGYHVGFYISESPTHYQVLGANQSNSTNISSLSKDNLVASRWPDGHPVVLGPVKLRATPKSVRESTSQA